MAVPHTGVGGDAAEARVAVRESGAAADRQSAVEFALNRRIYWLTWATAALAVVQTVTALWPLLKQLTRTPVTERGGA